jgi:GTPase SAR1 family protein
MYLNQNKISVLMLGDGAVGKTSLLKMYAEGTFSKSTMASVGLDYISKAFTPKDSDTEIPVKIWDTAG